MNIRDSIISNFKDCSKEDIYDSIIESIKDGDEVTLPGLGVFFEILWNLSDDKDNIIEIIKKGLNG